MRHKLLIVLILFFSGLFIPDAKSQVVVKVKPTRPKVIVKKPARAKRGYVWRDGHWVYNKKRGAYVWRKGQWIKKRPGKVWIKGHWKKVPGGQKWVPGHWK
jgi:hypothetical protein